MLKRILYSTGAIVAYLNFVGFICLDSFFRSTQLTSHLGPVPFFELPRWGLSVLFKFEDPLIWCCVIVLVASLATSKSALIVRGPRSGKASISEIIEFATVIGKLSWERLRPIFLVVTYSIIIFFGTLRADQVGTQIASDALSARPPLARSGLNIGMSVYIETIAGHSLPKGILAQNLAGDLSLL